MEFVLCFLVIAVCYLFIRVEILPKKAEERIITDVHGREIPVSIFLTDWNRQLEHKLADLALLVNRAAKKTDKNKESIETLSKYGVKF